MRIKVRVFNFSPFSLSYAPFWYFCPMFTIRNTSAEFVQCVDVDMWKLHIVDPHHPHHLHITYTSSPHHPHHLHIFNVDIPLHIHISFTLAMWPWRRTLLSLINIVTVKFSSKCFRRLVRNKFSLIPEIKILRCKIFPHPKVLTL